MSDPITAAFRRTHYTEHPTPGHPCNEGRRTDVRNVVFHDTEGFGSAETVARLMAEGAISGSVHAITDTDYGERLLPNDIVACGAPPLNFPGVHIEIPGFAAWSRLTWLLPANRRKLNRAAAWIARQLRREHIPPRFLTVAQLQAEGPRAPGYTSHQRVSLAFHQSTHTDPGPEDRKHFPYWWFTRRVRYYYKGKP